jgi:hypothetical protein
MSSNVTVNMDVTVEASAEVVVFGQASEMVPDVIVADIKLPVTDLYKGVDDGIFQFYGVTLPNEEDVLVEDIIGERNYNFTGETQQLENDIHTIINGGFDCSQAYPFADNYSAEYHTYQSFGRVALAAYTHSLFGHVAATAAIDNETKFFEKMNGHGPSDARLAHEITTKIYYMSVEGVTKIVKQVIGQDSSRARNEDNDLNNPVGRQSLEFIAGDIIYITIRLLPPIVSISGTTADVAAQLSAPQSNLFTPINYNMKITLIDPVTLNTPT